MWCYGYVVELKPTWGSGSILRPHHSSQMSNFLGFQLSIPASIRGLSALVDAGRSSIVDRSAPTRNKSWTHRIPTDSGRFCNMWRAPPLAPDQTCCSHGWTCHPWWISRATNVFFFFRQTDRANYHESQQSEGFFQPLTCPFWRKAIHKTTRRYLRSWSPSNVADMAMDTQGIPENQKSQGYKLDKNECPSPQIWHFIDCEPLPTLVYRII